eukprot:TRINITY_DN4446_c0_g1_i4.p1 TRINITY_DN4446_c0_g1~~TRINITY_DN4446_c0_g1_i4.p1  ORF type:complete len:431 (-),score=69.47 TRINITY_DN4446_c0_g1_i4:26-1318(-)
MFLSAALLRDCDDGELGSEVNEVPQIPRPRIRRGRSESRSKSPQQSATQDIAPIQDTERTSKESERPTRTRPRASLSPQDSSLINAKPTVRSQDMNEHAPRIRMRKDSLKPSTTTPPRRQALDLFDPLKVDITEQHRRSTVHSASVGFSIHQQAKELSRTKASASASSSEDRRSELRRGSTKPRSQSVTLSQQVQSNTEVSRSKKSQSPIEGNTACPTEIPFRVRDDSNVGYTRSRLELDLAHEKKFADDEESDALIRNMLIDDLMRVRQEHSAIRGSVDAQKRPEQIEPRRLHDPTSHQEPHFERINPSAFLLQYDRHMNPFGMNQQQNRIEAPRQFIASGNSIDLSYENLLRLDEKAVPTPLSPSKRLGFQVSVLKEESKEECSICLCSYERGDRVMTLFCEHAFHIECIEKWFDSKTACPVCRFDYG